MSNTKSTAFNQSGSVAAAQQPQTLPALPTVTGSAAATDTAAAPALLTMPPSESPPAPQPALQSGFYRWQHYTRSANQALLHQQYQLAEQHYQAALQQAEQLRQLDPLAEPHIAAWVISLHNLADLALLNGIPTQARTLLCGAFLQIWQLCQQQPLPRLWSHLHVCRRELAFFCQSFGSDAQCRQLLQLPWPASAALN